MKEVLSLVCHFFVEFGDFDPLFFPAGGAIHHFGQFSLFLCQFFFCLSIESWIIGFLTLFALDKKSIHGKIQSDYMLDFFFARDCVRIL